MSTTSTKGKQGTKGQKQIYEENVATVKFYFFMSVIGMTFYVLSVISQLASLQCMRYMSKPMKSDSNQLIDAGLDLNLEGGFGEYCKDGIILSTIVQILTIISGYFWMLFLAAPIYAVYKLWTGILAPWFFAPAAEDDENEEKKKRKKERKIQYKR